MDAAIIQKILDGDIQQFRYLIDHHKNAAFRVARSIVKSDLVAEDAVQDAFIKVFQHLRQYRKEASFSTWLYRIVLNEALRKSKQKKLVADDLSSIDETGSEPAIEPEAIEHLHIEEQKELINLILDKLKPNESLVLKLYYLDDLSMEEIVQVTDLSLANIKVLLHRARKSFARLYLQKTGKTITNETG